MNFFIFMRQLLHELQRGGVQGKQSIEILTLNLFTKFDLREILRLCGDALHVLSHLVLFLFLNVEDHPDGKEVNHFSPAEETEPNTESNNSTEEANQVLPAVGDCPGVLHHTVLLEETRLVK